MSDYCVHLVARGRVQSVYFRAFCRQQAQEAGLTGWSRNQADGSVDILLCGPQSAVEQAVAQIRRGPPAAQVSSLDSETVPNPQPRGFAIG